MIAKLAAALTLHGQQQPAWIYWVVLGSAAVIALFLWVLGRLFPSRKPHTAIGNALMHIEPIFRPSREKIIEAREHEEREEDQEGDPPDTAGRRSR